MVQPSCAGVHSTTRAGTFTMWTYSGGIYQFNLQLFACSTHSANWWPPSSQHLWYPHSLPPLLKSTIALKRESQRPALPLHSYTISSTVSEERGALASKHCFKFRGKSSLVIAQSKGCTHRSELDRQTRVRPQKTHPFPPAHTGTAPGSVPHTMQMGSDPIPSGKAKEASSEISGVSKSWAHTQNPWRASLEILSPATWNVTRVQCAQKFRLWLVQVQRLKLLGQISLSAFATRSNHQQMCLFLFPFQKNKLRTSSVNPTLSVNIWFSNLNCKTLLEYLLGFIMCIYHLHFLDAECPQVYWGATGTREIAAGNILNNIFGSFPSHLEKLSSKVKQILRNIHHFWIWDLGTLSEEKKKLIHVRFFKKREVLQIN